MPKPVLIIGSFRSAGCGFTICLVFAEHVSSTTKHHISCGNVRHVQQVGESQGKGRLSFIHKVKKTGMRLSFLLQNYSYC